MKKLGLVGGISWVSTVDYYRIINEAVNEKLGGLNFCECIIYSINFDDFVQNNTAGRWGDTLLLIENACKALEAAGADAIVLCANTAHAIADKLKARINLPIIDIIEETAKVITANDLKRAALLGTKFTMEMDFYRQKLETKGIEMMTPLNQDTRDFIQHTIKEELGRGTINPKTKQEYITILNSLIADGAECIILGCTELPLIISQADFKVPVFDTTQIHAIAAAKFALVTIK